MGKWNILDVIKSFIGGVAFRVFLWSNGMTQEQYWKAIYLQEKAYIEGCSGEPEFVYDE